jgi:LysM repeat protein
VSGLAAGKGRASYSAERTWRVAGVAGAGSLLAMLGIVVVGTSPGGGSSAAAAPDDHGATIAIGTAPGQTVALTTPATNATVPAAGPACTNTYTVLSGDYWIRIADGASITLDELLAANGATASTALFPGQTVCLPDGTTVVVTAAPTTTKTVTTARPVTTAAPAPITTPPVTKSHGS